MTSLLRKPFAILIILPALVIGAARHDFLFVWSAQAAPTSTQAAAQTPDWEPSIRKFEENDKVNPVKAGGIVFTGSSSIARWNTLGSEMSGLKVINEVLVARSIPNSINIPGEL
jgi:hypothetical protein